MDPIRTLYDSQSTNCARRLPDELSTQYGGDLDFPAGLGGRPYIVANFASTLDGVVSFDIPGQAGGAQISGSNEADRFIMGLLRASADAVIVGASTVDAVSPAHLWIAEHVYPAAADAYVRYRRDILRKSAHPLIVVVSGRGNLDLNRSVFHTSGIRVLIVTSQFGRERLIRAGADKLPSTRTRELPAKETGLDPRSIASLLEDELGAKLLLHEGGPTLFGRFIASGLIDELFLTMAPQIAGRSPVDQRPGLVANALFHPGTAPWLSLISVKQQASHLYLRYRKIEAE